MPCPNRCEGLGGTPGTCSGSCCSGGEPAGCPPAAHSASPQSPEHTCFPRKLQQSFCEGKAIIFSRVLFPDECPGIHFQGRGVGEVNAHENVMSLWVFFQAAAAGGAKELVGRKE